MATVGELDAKALVEIVADMLSEIKAKTLCYTLGNVDFGKLLHMLAHTLAELQVEKPANTPCDMKENTLIDVLAYMLAGIKRRHIPRHPVCRLRHWSIRWLIG